MLRMSMSICPLVLCYPSCFIKSTFYKISPHFLSVPQYPALLLNGLLFYAKIENRPENTSYVFPTPDQNKTLSCYFGVNYRTAHNKILLALSSLCLQSNKSGIRAMSYFTLLRCCAESVANRATIIYREGEKNLNWQRKLSLKSACDSNTGMIDAVVVAK